MVKLSVLDLAYIGEGFTPADALANSLDLAQHCEAAGFERFGWPNITTLLASPAPPPPYVSAMSPEAQRRYAWELAGSCCQTTRQW